MLQPHQTRVVFLDFDGVLHPPKAIAGAQPPLTPAQIQQGWSGTFVHLHVLQKLLEGHPEIAVLVSSSWRSYLNAEELKELLNPISPWFAGAVRKGNRDEAIKEWLEQHSIQDYVILDDVAKFFPGVWPRLILCNSALGISDPAVQQKLQLWIQGEHSIYP
ncbi:HAD domain-containing protein [Comamonas sp.]|uniref:HAD domain-containing protein n=1 Tax=Comamonas sp. TaxID=34028 RepID=UPI002FC7181D